MATRVAVLEANQENLDDRFRDHERRQNGTIEDIRDELKSLNKTISKALQGRPTWGVALLITSLVGLVASFLTKAVMGG